MRILNYTRQPIILEDSNTQAIYEPIVEVSLESRSKIIDYIRDEETGLYIPVIEITEQKLRNPPPRKQGVVYIVSSIVAAHSQDRDDLLAPGRVDVSKGVVKSAKALVKPRPRPTERI